MTDNTLPVIDVAPFIGGDREQSQEPVERIRVACLDWWFFQVLGHGIIIDARFIAGDGKKSFAADIRKRSVSDRAHGHAIARPVQQVVRGVILKPAFFQQHRSAASDNACAAL